MKPIRGFLPSESSPLLVEAPSAIIRPASILSPLFTIGRWFMQVPWLLLWNLMRWYVSRCPLSVLITISSAESLSTIPLFLATTAIPESLAALYSMPVPTIGESVVRSGTACLCMFDPIRARLASSFSRKGISAVATETICLGETSISCISLPSTSIMSSR